MRDHRLAVYTFNQFVAPYQSDRIRGFREAEPGTFLAIENAEGFVARSGYEGEEGPSSWGEQVFPDCWANSNGDGWAPSTLSLDLLRKSGEGFCYPPIFSNWTGLMYPSAEWRLEGL